MGEVGRGRTRTSEWAGRRMRRDELTRGLWDQKEKEGRCGQGTKEVIKGALGAGQRKGKRGM